MLPSGGTAGQVLTRDSGTGFESHWAPGGGSASSITVLATANLTSFTAVTSNGKPADSSNLALRGKVLGIALSDISNGFTGSVTGYGEVENPAWTWSPGDVVFLNGTSLSTTAPSTGWSQVIGTARSSTVLVVELGTPISF